MRYTLTYIPKATAELATLWLTAKDQKALSESADAIERELRDDPDVKGEVIEGALRKIVKTPLVFYFVVSPDDCQATVWSVRWAKN
jgi:hypothetical protein